MRSAMFLCHFVGYKVTEDAITGIGKPLNLTDELSLLPIKTCEIQAPMIYYAISRYKKRRSKRSLGFSHDKCKYGSVGLGSNGRSYLGDKILGTKW